MCDFRQSSLTWLLCAVHRKLHNSSSLFVYCGHGAGEKICDSQKMRKWQCPSAMLWGCSSGTLSVQGVCTPCFWFRQPLLNWLMNLVLVPAWESTSLYLNAHSRRRVHLMTRPHFFLDMYRILPSHLCHWWSAWFFVQVHDPQGVAINYLLGGAHYVVANMWDVTDKDIDKLSMECMRLCFGSDGNDTLPAVTSSTTSNQSTSNGSLLPAEALAASREICKLKNAVGCAPVIYGLPRKTHNQ